MKTILTTLTLQIMENMHYDLGMVKVVITQGKPRTYLMQITPKFPRDTLRVLRSKGVVLIEVKVR